MTYEAVVKAAWATDPDFVELCKTMYGPEASVADVLHAERVAKFAAIKGAKGAAKGAKAIKRIQRERKIKAKAFTAGALTTAALTADPGDLDRRLHPPREVYKMSPGAPDVHVPGTGTIKRKRKPVYDNRGVALSKAREARGLGNYQYKRDDNGRFASTGRIAVDALTAGGIGAAGGGYTGGKAVNQLSSMINALKKDPKGRRALGRTVKAVAGHGGKAAALGGAAALMGTIGGHHGKQAFTEFQEQRALEAQHKKDVRYATGDLVMDELEGRPRNARVITRQGKKTAVTSITTPKAKKTKEFGKSRVPVDMGGEISEIDTDKRQVFGWASITKIAGKPVVDLQGDFIDDDELEKAAYDYVQKSRVGGAMHWRVDDDGNLIRKNNPYHVSDLIESVVFTDEKVEKMGIETDKTGWWVGFQVHDDRVWDKVKSGDWKGFSIHGAGRRTPTSLEDLSIGSTELGE